MLWEVIKIALQALRGHKVRSLLTVLSVTIGAFSIVVMLSLAESGQATLVRSVEEIGGTRLVWWVPNPPRDARDRSRYSKGLTRGDVSLLRDLPTVALATGFSTLRQQTVYVSADKRENVDVAGIIVGMLDGLTWPMQAGRDFLPEEDAQYARVCILTDGVAQRIFRTKTVVGETLVVLDKPYRVTGVLERRKMMGVSLGFDWDNTVFVPISTLEKREGMPSGGLVLVAFTDGSGQNETVEAIGTARLLAKHNGVEDFQSINFGEVLESFYQYFIAFRAIVAVIAAMSLFAGGIGVMNIMLVSVTERTREIGIRKALGATIWTVMVQFLGEAVVLSMIGGLVGVACGIGLLAIAHAFVARWSDFWVPIYSMTGIFLALGATSAIGIFFGVWPAFQASRLDIVECLRR